MSRARWIGLLVALLLSAHAFGTVTGSEPLLDQQQRPWAPEAPAEQLPLWPDGMKIAQPFGPKDEVFGTAKPAPGAAGKPIVLVEHVTRPTMTIYHPRGKNTGTAVMVFPGGGFHVLAIDLEGTEICDWLTSRGITCALLKYRVPGSGPYYSYECDCAREPSAPMALQDAQRAMGLLRERAASLGVEPHKIGVMGFSAGGRMVADISNHATRSYPLIDDADRQPSRPDFAIAGYPGHLWKEPGLTLDSSVKIDPHCPPTFIVQAQDDATDSVRESLAYYFALTQANIPSELHLFPHGGHAFGVRKANEPVGQWTQLAERWMTSIGMLPAP